MRSSALLSGRLLTSNVIWSVLGAGLPLLVALWAIPMLLHMIGIQRFGLLSIIWMGVSYFSLLDMGIGRALTKQIAERLGKNGLDELPALIATGLRLAFALGTIGSVLLAAISSWLAERVLNIPSNLVHEAIWSFGILAATLPFVVSTGAQLGVLQAYQRFAAINVVRIPLGIMNFLAPVLISTLTSSLATITMALAVSRVLAWLIYLRLCLPYTRQDMPASFLDRRHVRALLGFGSWVTVSNITGPMLVYFDRFLIGALLSMSAVAFYATPYDAITRLWIIVEAVTGVMFPALTMAFANDAGRVEKILSVAGRSLLIIMMPIMAMVILFAPEILSWWVGPAFSAHSTLVLRWLAVGVFVNCMARLPYTMLQSAGRPDLTAKLHMMELLPYGFMLWGLIRSYDINGAAAAWTVRIFVDALAIFALSVYITKPYAGASQLRIGLYTVLAAALLGVLGTLQSLQAKVVIAVLLLVLCAGLAVREIVIGKKVHVKSSLDMGDCE